MAANFIMYTSFRCFRSYFHSLAILSLSIVLFFCSVLKFLLLKFNPHVLSNIAVRDFFQLSVFLFVPLFAVLAMRKYGYGLLNNEDVGVKRMPQWLCLATLIFLIVMDVLLFAYLLIGEFM